MLFPFSTGSSSSSTGSDASLTTVRNFIQDAMREIGALGERQPLEPADAQIALRYFQAMSRLMAGDGYLLYTVTRRPFALVSGQQDYTVGQDGCDFTAPRPLIGLEGPGMLPEGDTVEQPLDVVSRAEWDREPLKSLTDIWPRKVKYEPSTADTGTFSFWPIPTTAPTFYAGWGEPLPYPTDLNTELVFPPGGYEELWRLSLARRLCGPFTRTFTEDQQELLKTALGAVRGVNDPGPPIQGIDAALCQRGGYDIRSGQYR